MLLQPTVSHAKALPCFAATTIAAVSSFFWLKAVAVDFLIDRRWTGQHFDTSVPTDLFVVGEVWNQQSGGIAQGVRFGYLMWVFAGRQYRDATKGRTRNGLPVVGFSKHGLSVLGGIDLGSGGKQHGMGGVRSFAADMQATGLVPRQAGNTIRFFLGYRS